MKIVAIVIIVLLGTLAEARKHCQTYYTKRHRRNISSWQDARDVCRRIGMDLVKIDSMEEDMFLQSILRRDTGGRNQRGWYIGGIYKNGAWQWADGTRMIYKGFPVEDSLTMSTDTVTNYAAIFKRGGYPPSFEWGYLSKWSESKMGAICESTTC